MIIGGLRKSILVEFSKEACETEIQVARSIVDGSNKTRLPIHAVHHNELKSSSYRFNWSGWIADFLDLEFQKIGLSCPQSIMICCCNLLVALAIEVQKSQDLDGRKYGFCNLLGPYPHQRICKTCETVWRTKLSSPETMPSLKDSQDDLQQTIDQALSTLSRG